MRVFIRTRYVRRASPSKHSFFKRRTIPIDDLTRLPLRGEFLENAAVFLEAARISGRPVALLVIDVDYFKREEDLLDAIDEGVAAAVLKPVAVRGGDCYAFAHELLEVLRASVNPRRLRRIHQRVAHAIERRSPDAVGVIAGHFDRADDRPNAYRYALLAAHRAKEVYAHAEVTEFLRIAERTAASPADVADVRVRLAEIAEAATRYEEVEELCHLALQ
ncbi:MAG: hypothetical protein ACR2G6_11845 [Gemmatimonadaceae bacterium]